MKPYTYIPKDKELRNNQKNIGEYNAKTKQTRINIPAGEVPHVTNKVIDILRIERIIDKPTATTFSGLGSTEAYLKQGYKRPYAGDIDLVYEANVEYNEDRNELKPYVKKMQQKLTDRLGWITVISFGNVLSTMMPLGDFSTYENHAIQIDLMIAPISENHRILQYMKKYRYAHHEKYELIDDAYYLKGAQANIFRRAMLDISGYTMGPMGIYQRNYKKYRGTGKDLASILGVLQTKVQKQKSKKASINLNLINTLNQQTDFFQGQPVTSHDIIGDIAHQDIYPEILNEISIKKEYMGDYDKLFNEVCGIKEQGGFNKTMQQFHNHFKNGYFTEEQVIRICYSAISELISDNKSVLFFPYILKTIREYFPFIPRKSNIPESTPL